MPQVWPDLQVPASPGQIQVSIWKLKKPADTNLGSSKGALMACPSARPFCQLEKHYFLSGIICR